MADLVAVAWKENLEEGQGKKLLKEEGDWSEEKIDDLDNLVDDVFREINAQVAKLKEKEDIGEVGEITDEMKEMLDDLLDRIKKAVERKTQGEQYPYPEKGEYPEEGEGEKGEGEYPYPEEAMSKVDDFVGEGWITRAEGEDLKEAFGKMNEDVEFSMKVIGEILKSKHKKTKFEKISESTSEAKSRLLNRTPKNRG